MAPGQKQPPQGQKKKGYNPYNKFKKGFWKKKKNNNDNAPKPNDGDSNPVQSYVGPSSPVTTIQIPISK